MKLNPKKKYLQVALNSTLEEAAKIISQLPVSDRIIVEAGTPLIKRYGLHGISKIKSHCQMRFWRGVGASLINPSEQLSLNMGKQLVRQIVGDFIKDSKKKILPSTQLLPYIAADLKTMDRGETEVNIAWSGGADAAIALGTAPIETLNAFIAECKLKNMDSMIDMMNVEYPLSVLSSLKRIPDVVILHRGVDEEHFNKEKQIPLHEIRRIKSRYDIMISIAGGDSIREVQRSIFNDADIVVIWKSVYQSTDQTVELINEFLKEIK